MTHDENITVAKAGLYRIFYKQSSNVEEGKKIIQERIENHQSVIFIAIENHVKDVMVLDS
ncbi:hypothetical protein GXN76_08285 [Kroppenstedtia pulmonis]|uniref:Uncharacterized protein n=1 Tax=Kroppenstedtia pulmonis TaxID=1380685 RepID=A0A7D4BFM3_9BACL|nr:hypothetical protein [Kroppenstedtia pulmonis]QKG84472.1 hypothetical protein GXN76_08285 [Kroppenstedtia pulmonis]